MTALRPCVRVPTTAGERTRKLLAEQGLLDDTYQIERAGANLHIPIRADQTMPEEFEVVHREVPRRVTADRPADLLGYAPSYERLGDIVIIDEDDAATAQEITGAIVASDLDASTVLNRASPIEGEYRVRDWELLYGDSTETTHREYGCSFTLDIAQVYFSPRLATERHRVVEQVESDEHVVDMFAGVGPFAVPVAARGAAVTAIDLNPAAIEYLRLNADQNDVADRVSVIEGDAREVADDRLDRADRVIMNLPHTAEAFLERAVAFAADRCTLHYYDIQSEEAPFEPGLEAIRTAAGDGYAITDVERQVVRSYSPKEQNVCLDVRLERAE